jgi:glycosyltransferase involved in cell wall biosynthesis
MSEFLNSREALILKFASIFFNGIIVVNNQLKTWASKELFCKEVIYIANFTQPAIDDIPITKLSGTAGKRILCLANLRPQKNHAMLLDVAVRLKATNPDWTFHLVGKDFNDEYSRTLHQSIIDRQLENYVFLYGSRKDINPIIDQCEIAILTSKSEGLPVALLEFGLCKKPVVVTAVGEIPLIIESGSNGFILMPNDDVGFYEAIVKLIDDNSLRIKLGDALFETIRKNNTSGTIMSIYLDWTKNLLQ